jgi:SLOG in TRPM, prokaryote
MKTARVDAPVSLLGALRAIGLEEARPALVLTGGADALTNEDMERLRPLFVECLAPLAEKLNAYVLDGGTDSGIMRLMGEARAQLDADFPLIGVAADGTVKARGEPMADPRARLEPHHTHFLLVPGVEWGDESPWIARVASSLAGQAGSITVLVDGGDISWEDVSHSVDAGRRVFVVAGSGRLADTLDDALRGRDADKRAIQMARSGFLSMIDPLEHPEKSAKTLENALVGGG